MEHTGEKRNKNWDLMVKPKGMGQSAILGSSGIIVL
jgi:hypothetical protein